MNRPTVKGPWFFHWYRNSSLGKAKRALRSTKVSPFGFPTGAVDLPTGTAEFPTGAANLPTGAAEFPTSAVEFPTGTAGFPTGTFDLPIDSLKLQYGATWSADGSTF